ncbi:MAG: gliding motility-associated ABC transporter substrate-binding protein GldG [Flavitalea sp.]
MEKILRSKYGWILAIIALVVVNYIASLVHARYDLTSEKRYTLSAPTKTLLNGLKEPVSITVFLEGDMPAGFKQLSNSSRELLEEFRELSRNNINVKFERPGEGLTDTARAAYIRYISDSLGIKPTNVKVTAKAGEAQEERLVYAGALVSSNGRNLPVNFLQGQSLTGGYESLNNSETLLEYKFANAIDKITRDSVPVIGYLIGNGQPLTYNVFDLIENTLKPDYGFGFLPIDSVPIIPQDFDALMIVKPTTGFTDDQKLKLDQYIMNGGKVIWMIDKLYAEMDSLMRKQGDFIAFDRNLNLDDMLFKYGVRINSDLLQDLQSEKIPLVVGNYGNQPQMQLVPWPYFPLLSNYNDHPISKNLDNVLSIFPNSMDTVVADGVRKTYLLSSSQSSRILSTPAMVSLNSVQTEADLRTFAKSNVPVAVLLEGKFSSIFSNRIPVAVAQQLQALGQPFRNSSEENSMIVVSDADIVTNVFTQEDGPLPMGYNQFTQVQHANKDFLLNCIEYLVNPKGVLEARSKDIALRLLDSKKVEQEKSTWQLITVVAPVLLVLAGALLYQLIRKRKYSRV